MAPKPKPMSQIKQMLRMRMKGKGIKTIASDLQMSKNTVKAYFKKIEDANYQIEELLTLDDPVLEARFHAGNKAYLDDRWEALKPRLDTYVSELKRLGVTKHLLWEEYKSEVKQAAYSYSQFCHHLYQYKKSSKPTAVLQHDPGDKLYIDFAGKKISYIDQQNGQVIDCQLFVGCLPYSGYAFAIAVHTQNIEDFIYALKRCLQFLGGTPACIVPDNLKSAVIRANKYEPDLNEALLDFANHYETTAIPARVRRPQDKALVENQVRLFYTHIHARLRNEQFFSLDSLNEAIFEKVHLFNQIRMQKRPYSREEKFLADEKQHLRPLPLYDFEITHQAEYKVTPNNHIYLVKDKHYYSVPYTYIGQKVKVLFTRSIVNIYHEGNKIAEHLRNRRPSGYTTIKEHLCSHHQHYLDRSPEKYIRRAWRHSENFGRLIEAIFAQNKHPEQLYKSCDGIFSIQRKTDGAVFEKAVELALTHKQYHYGFIKNLIENNMIDHPLCSSESIPALPEHQNVRGKKYYQ